MRPTSQTWRLDTTPRDQDHVGAAINFGPEPLCPAARDGPEQTPERRCRTNWRLDREDEQATDPGTTYDPLLDDLASAMSRGKKDRHLQEQAATIMRRSMIRSQACCQPTGLGGGEHTELEKRGVDFASLPVHDIGDGTDDAPSQTS